MDFASLMKSQISKSKPLSGDARVSKAPYCRRADLEVERQAEYAAEQARIVRERTERQARKRKLELDEEESRKVRDEKRRRLAEEGRARREAEEAEQERRRRKRLGLPEVPNAGVEEGSTSLLEGDVDIPDLELQAKLREINEPAILFDESYSARVKRYRTLTLQALAPVLSKGPIPTTISLLPESEIGLISTSLPPESDIAGSTHLYTQLASYFTLILTEWSKSLALRSPSTKQSSSGAAATRTYSSVLQDLTPLFRTFEAKSLSPTLLKEVATIAHHAQHRRYVRANDAYLQLAIGKSAWPIGVTMVGIHERSAREKLHEHGRDSPGGGGGNKEAHIMADEMTRKYLQSIKRCLSYAQTRWPPDDVGQLMG